jgi:protein gp37
MSDSSIEWTDTTWNPTTGCDRVSAGCDNCYALTMARRLKAMGSAKYQRDGDPVTSGPGFGLTVHHDTLDEPFHWRKPRRVFVNSMSDLFHRDVPSAFLASVFDVMARTPQHTYQILTKRHGRLQSVMKTAVPGEGWPLPNVHLGVSVDNQQWADLRVPALIGVEAAVRFLSCEPLLGPIDLRPWLHGLDWVIVGGESGPGARRMELDWAQEIVDDCLAADVPVFVKQLGSAHGSHKGSDMAAWPESLRVRQWPRAEREGES